jgi:hypothetical protein
MDEAARAGNADVADEAYSEIRRSDIVDESMVLASPKLLEIDASDEQPPPHDDVEPPKQPAP